MKTPLSMAKPSALKALVIESADALLAITACRLSLPSLSNSSNTLANVHLCLRAELARFDRTADREELGLVDVFIYPQG